MRRLIRNEAMAINAAPAMAPMTMPAIAPEERAPEELEDAV